MKQQNELRSFVREILCQRASTRLLVGCAAFLLITLPFAAVRVCAQQQQHRVAASTTPNTLPQPVAWTLQESPEAITMKTPRYELASTREGFGVDVRRGGEVVLQSAQKGDASTNLSFEFDGKPQRITRLRSFARTDDGLTLDYETSSKSVSARVELRPFAFGVRIITHLIGEEYGLVPSLRYRLAPSGLWHGGGFQGWRDVQTFPLNRAHMVREGFLSKSTSQGTPAWYATKGVGLWIRTPRDFRYTINARVNGADDGLLSAEMPGTSVLTYDIIVGNNVRDVVQHIVREIGYPRAAPPADYFRLPVYTTWVEHKVPVSQVKVLEYARAIRDNKLPCGVIELDDKWEATYGDMNFDAAKFPDPKQMVDELHRMNYRVTLWVHPFVNTDSRTYAEHRTDGLLLPDTSGEAGLTKWWNGNAAVWDFTNPRAAAEFRARLERLQRNYGFDGFKFDGGDAHRVPQDMKAFVPITPAEYADVYNRETTAHFPLSETRVGMYSQPYGVVQRLIDKHSVWGAENGLAALIPEAIINSLRGYQYIMPDMIGGNQYNGDVITKELLIRWAQASALMPLIQFSVGPWHFDQETVQLSRAASELHLRFAPYIIRLAEAAPRTGEPILASLWYQSPNDQETFAITDEFMVGEDVVVAPVLVKGATKRDVYLPAGRWRDYKTKKVLEGKRWMRDYAAPLDTLPLFIRAGSNIEQAAMR